MSEEREDVETKSSDSPEIYQQTKFMAWFEKAFPWLLVSGATLGLTLMIILPIIFFQEKTGDQLKAQSDLRLALLYTTGGAIAALGLLETYRKNTNDRTKANADINAALKNQEHQTKVLKEQIRQFDENAFKERKAERRERYTKAVEQLGDEKAPVRMGGVYTLVGLVDEWLEEENLPESERLKEGQVIINNLCAYIRSPFTLTSYYDELSKGSPTPDGVYKDNQQEFYTDKAELKAEADVRLGIIQEIHERLQGSEENTPGKWSDFEYNFSGSTFFYPIDFTNSYYTKPVNFVGTKYQDSANFSHSTYKKQAIFSNSIYQSEVYFYDSAYWNQARFSNSTYQSNASFYSSTYWGEVYFHNSLYLGETKFSSSTYQNQVSFNDSIYQEPVSFNGSIYWNKNSLICFYSSIYQSRANFNNSTYRGSTYFHNSLYLGETNFYSSIYHNTVEFGGSTFQNGAQFEGSIYQGSVSFSDSIYHGSTYFRGPTYQGEAVFSGSIFYSGASFGENNDNSSSPCFIKYAPNFYQENYYQKTLFGSNNNDFTVDNDKGYPIDLNPEGIALKCKFLTQKQREYLEGKFQEIEKINNKLFEVKDLAKKTEISEKLRSLNEEFHKWREEVTTVKVEDCSIENTES